MPDVKPPQNPNPKRGSEKGTRTTTGDGREGTPKKEGLSPRATAALPLPSAS